MKPLRTALADALHLKDLRDLTHHRHQTGRPRSAAPERHGSGRPGPGRTATGRGPGAAGPCEQDPLFEFLRSMHHFLTAPQNPAGAEPGPRPQHRPAYRRPSYSLPPRDGVTHPAPPVIASDPGPDPAPGPDLGTDPARPPGRA
ncbi:hypothetical protein GCM10010387_19640 [Streptomyces inusitatus]|uniref:Uncharacterized protein n=1 Tax=Streptomyces inusitatus TaxID=68221 RepID=A0A918PXJ1_9ACTN|nr:hypothetical protein [Streptomyces inusitatus]GGZ26413.1 hypothetical protein GCM10010387_19640 [Streptomyces inusitatus]